MMNVYIQTLFFAGIIFSLLRYITAHFRALVPYLSFIIGLVSILVTLVPLVRFIKDTSFSIEIPKEEVAIPDTGISQNGMLSFAEEKVEKTLKKRIDERFDNKVKSIQVILKYDEKDGVFYASECRIALERINDVENIHTYLLSELGRHTAISIIGGKDEAKANE